MADRRDAHLVTGIPIRTTRLPATRFFRLNKKHADRLGLC
jgi:hypothetical protein